MSEKRELRLPAYTPLLMEIRIPKTPTKTADEATMGTDLCKTDCYDSPIASILQQLPGLGTLKRIWIQPRSRFDLALA